MFCMVINGHYQECADGTAKFWLNPVGLVRPDRPGAAALRPIGRFNLEHRVVFQEAWNELSGD